MLEEFAKWCAEYFRISEKVWFGLSRTASIANPRKVSMVAARRLFDAPLAEIAEAFNRTYEGAVTRAIDECERDPQMNKCADKLAKIFTKRAVFTEA